jgi:hypothetical protein
MAFNTTTTAKKTSPTLRGLCVTAVIGVSSSTPAVRIDLSTTTYSTMTTTVTIILIGTISTCCTYISTKTAGSAIATATVISHTTTTTTYCDVYDLPWRYYICAFCISTPTTRFTITSRSTSTTYHLNQNHRAITGNRIITTAGKHSD